MAGLPILIGSVGWVASTGDKNFRKTTDIDLVMDFTDFEEYLTKNLRKFSRIAQVRRPIAALANS
jgi:hypothetical protein